MVFKILKKLSFSVMAALICINTLPYSYYNILNEFIITLDHENICKDTIFVKMWCIVPKILKK